MSNGLKLGCFFAVSVALHGAGLWAVAGTLQPRSAAPAAEVSIIDRDLFFRHAERTEIRASQAASAVARLDPSSGDAVSPNRAEASVLPAPAASASRSEPERRAPEAPETTVARLDPSVMEPAPPLIDEPLPLDNTLAGRPEPMRLSGVADARQLPAARAPVQRSAAAAQASRIRSSESLASAGPIDEARAVPAPQVQPAEAAAELERDPPAAPESLPQRVQHPAGAGSELAGASAAETLAGAGAGRAARRTADDIARVEASPWPVRAPTPTPVPELQRGEVQAARPVAAAETPTPEPAPAVEPDGEAARVAAAPSHAVSPVAPLAPVGEVAPMQAPSEPERVTRYDRQPTLRGTLAPELLAPREPRAASSVEAPAAASPPQVERRQRTAELAEPTRVRPGTAVVPSRAVPRAERLAARAQQPTSRATRPVRVPAPDPAPAPAAEVQRREALAPARPAPPVDASDGRAQGTGDPADRFTRTYKGGECFYPVRVASRDGDAIRGYGVQAESVRRFRDAFVEALGFDPEVEWRPLTDAQCTGISFTRLILGGSAPTVQIDLARKELEDGDELAGRVTGSQFDFVTLLVIDDSGRVHNVLEYLHPASSELEFSVPVHPVDDGADRVQLIMAVAASQPLPSLSSATVMHGDDFFPELMDQAREAGASLELGLEDFVILDDPA